MKTPRSHERIVLTGMGIVSPLGHDIESVWKAILAGRSGTARTTIFDASTFPTTFSAEVKDYDFRRYVQHPSRHDQCSRSSGFVIGATVQACRQAGIDVESQAPADHIDRTRMGIYLGA
ncbi:MAG TPA: beta-ketoacyl synthase N-terminal-like domain-containing protein, partial [Sedimentisphaerales bacterium]|nr:beta-ketoacyl synthase N-terminal-like domain-containing protein [Sedimentisphaerales bacterium]